MKSCLLAAASVLALCGAAKANLITNGSFETGTIPRPAGAQTDPSFVTVYAGETNIFGWTVNSGSVDYIGTYWTAADGNRSLDMSGNSAGSISQTFNTTIGQQYLLTFALAGNPDQASVKSLDVNVGVGGGTYNFQNFPGVPTRTDMYWVTDSLKFTANSALTTLSFASGNDSAYGPALDNVIVSAVPLPPALPMFGGALLALAAFGYMRSRRRGSDAIPSGLAA